MTGGFAREREVAVEAGLAAAVVCRRVQSRLVTEDTLVKKDRSPVTVADFGSQAVVCQRLLQAFPDDPIVGEESGAALRENDAMRAQVTTEVRHVLPDASEADVVAWIDRGADPGGRERFWVLDPIDGTKGFLRGQQYAVALGLVVDGEVKVAILSCPNLPVEGSDNLGALFVAVRGEGTYVRAIDAEGESRVTASPETDSARARILESVEAAHGNHSTHDVIKEHLGVAVDSVRLDSQAKYGVLARGGAEVYLRMPTRADYRECIWDQAAGSLVIEEAGGRVTDAFGRPLDFTTGRRLLNNEGIIATNGPLHDRVLEAVKASQ